MARQSVTRRQMTQMAVGAAALLTAKKAAAGVTEPATAAAHPGAVSGKAGSIPYSRFGFYQVNDSDLDQAPTLPFPFVENSKFKAVNTGIDEPAVQVNFEDFLPGPDIVWSMFHDEVQYVTGGHAQITFHLPPLMQASGSVTASPGAIYLLPRGARIVWRVLGSQPFRHLCICIPNPGYPIPVARSAQADSRHGK